MKTIRQWLWGGLMMAVAAVSGLSFAADWAQAGDMTVLSLTRSAKLHVGPSTPSRVIEMVAKDARCQQLDTQGKWIQVSMEKDGHTGWIHQSYLRPVADAETAEIQDMDLEYAVTIEAAPVGGRRHGSVAKKATHHKAAHHKAAGGPRLKLSKSAKLHADASGPSRVLKIVKRGETGVWLDKVDVWVKLRMDSGGRTGWIHQSYLMPANKKLSASGH